MNPNDIPASSWQIVVASKDERIASSMGVTYAG